METEELKDLLLKAQELRDTADGFIAIIRPNVPEESEGDESELEDSVEGPEPEEEPTINKPKLALAIQFLKKKRGE